MNGVSERSGGRRFGIIVFRCLRFQQAHGGIGGSRGTADARPAMNEHRRVTIPSLQKRDEPLRIHGARQCQSIRGLSNIVEGELQVPAVLDAGEIAMRRIRPQQAHHMGNTMPVDERLHPVERAYDDHGESLSNALR